MKVLVAGVGKLGFILAKALVDEGAEVTVIDKSEQVIESVKSILDVMTVKANALDLMVLKELEVSDYDLVLAMTRNDEANVVLCTISKKMGCKKAIARVRNPEYHKHLTFLGEELNIDHIINPDYQIAQAIEKYLSKKYLLMSDDFVGGKVRLVEFNIGEDKHFVGKRIMDLEGFEELLIAVLSRKGTMIIPNGQTVLEENDLILVCGEAYNIETFDKIHSGVTKAKKIEKVMILGGGKIGLYLGSLLLNEGVEVTIIEADLERCYFLKEKLPEANIIHGDGTDMDLLKEEMVHTYDGFVAATGIDEANLLIALVIKQFGIYKAVAKISRSNYNAILDTLVIDGIFNTNLITANQILKVVRGSNTLSVNLMLSGDAEFAEFALKEGSSVLDKKVKDLDLPTDMLIIAVVRGSEVIIPKGDTILKEGDHAVLFCSHNQLDLMKRLFQPKEKRKLLKNPIWTD